jgi:hypothetical protein
MTGPPIRWSAARSQTLSLTPATAAGFAVSLALTFTVLPALGYAVTAPDAWVITAIYTAASILRSYAVRRAFNG